jgi:hypothetical protein
MKKLWAIVRRLIEARVSWERFCLSVAYEQMLMAGGYDKSMGEEPCWFFKKESRARWLLWNISFLYITRKCILFDHDLKCEGSAGPDSGREDFSCARCGADLGRVIYY